MKVVYELVFEEPGENGLFSVLERLQYLRTVEKYDVTFSGCMTMTD